MQTLEEASGQLEETPSARERPLTEDEKWNAVLSRNARFDGKFVFAVHSTHVYCRPSCPSKHASRHNVEFFQGSDEAEMSGFLACKRCRPRDLTSPRSELLDRICKYIESNLDKKITLESLSAHVGMSPFHLQRTFKRSLGISPRQYVEALRLGRMKDSLRNGETVNNALYNAGFSSRSRLYERPRNKLGVNPGTFRRGGEGLEIQYTIVDSPLGRLLVASTEKGICGVCMGSSDTAVVAALLGDYPQAVVHRNDSGMKKWVTAFLHYFDGQRFPPDLPIDVQATAFQWKVWREIQSIPYGATTTYSDIAQTIGQPQGARAVANACASNPVALVVPCHRVIGRDGGLRGYKWGTKRKQSLLSLEQMGQRRSATRT